MVAAYAGMPVALISDNLARMVAGGPRIRPWHAGGHMCGTALTVKTRPGDNLMVHKAVDLAEPGDVIVVDGGGDLTNALIGELIITHARSRGVAGFVLNAAVRDLDFVSRGDFPVYAAGVTHRGPYKDGPGEINVPVAIDGMLIEPGDLMVGDLDGVVAEPRERAGEILAAAKAQQEKEQQTLRDIAGPGWDRAWVDAFLTARGCEGI
jgi:regulator of RNase E activity RraA